MCSAVVIFELLATVPPIRHTSLRNGASALYRTQNDSVALSLTVVHAFDRERHSPRH
eukprot:m.555403 g.555403  ORF g.555403 m.555403 type:complete len:57 (+) comp22181_c0_seq32:234-404(+)